MLVFKAVKPSKMKVDAFRLEFLTMAHKAEREIKKDFQKTVETWDHKVTFDSQISLVGGPHVLVGTDDEIYILVSIDTGVAAGRGKYPIVAKHAKSLVFNTGYKAKTTPGVIGSVSGGPYGPQVKRKAVMHPGHVGRHFDELIAKKWKPKFKRMAEDAMRKAAQKSGHKYR